MLVTSVKRYITLRRTLGYGLLQANRLLLAYAQFAVSQGDTHIRVATAVAWATAASTPGTRYVRLNAVVLLARFLHAEDSAHEIPPSHLFPPPQGRLMPYIYSSDELRRIVSAAAILPRTYPLRCATYAMLFGMIAATGLRISEALNVRLSDVETNGVLLIRRGKCGKSRLIPLHPTVMRELEVYLEARRKLPTTDDHLFLSAGMRRIGRSMATYTFRRLALHAGITQTGTRPCRIHDLRHTFATRSLEKCPKRREDVAAHFVALATYLGHEDITQTYWYSKQRLS
jgi:integrase/recombinase XerD